MDSQRKSAAAWFEIPCADLDRAQRFYETILGCRMAKDDFGDAGDVMCVFPAERGGVSGALVKRAFQQPSSSGTIFFRSANNGTCDRVCPDPDGWHSNAWCRETFASHPDVLSSINAMTSSLNECQVPWKKGEQAT